MDLACWIIAVAGLLLLSQLGRWSPDK